MLRFWRKKYGATAVDMMQTYLLETNPQVERRVRQQRNGSEYLYFYTEKRFTDSGAWETERPISPKQYIQYLMEGDSSLHAVHKIKYRFSFAQQSFSIDVYPFCADKAILRAALPMGQETAALPPELTILEEVTGQPAYKNKALAKSQLL